MINVRDVNAIRQNPLFRSVEPDDLQLVCNRHVCRFEEFGPGQVIRAQGSACDEVVVLVSGGAAAQFLTFDGRVMEVETLSAPEILASAFLFSPQQRYPVQVTAVSSVRAFVLPITALLDLARTHEPVLQTLLSDMGTRASFLAQKLRLTQFATLRQRLAHYLLHEIALCGSCEFELKISKKHLAEVLGAARQSLFRVLGELQDRGIAEIDGDRITVTDTNELERIASDSQ